MNLSCPVPLTPLRPPVLTNANLNGPCIQPYQSLSASTRKRKFNDENLFTSPSSSQRPSPGIKRSRSSLGLLPLSERIESILDAIEEMDWSLPDFLYHLFLFGNDSTGQKVHRSRRHAACVSRFLKGRSSYFPGQILQLWYTHPDGNMSNDEHATSLTYSTVISYHEIKPIRAMLTSFAAQVIETKLNKEAETAVRPSNGLFVSTVRENGGKTTWVDVGAVTVSSVARMLQEHQPLTWHLLSKVACRDPRKRAGIVAVRQRRPVDHIVTHILSFLNYSRTQEARLLPVVRGILYFAFSTSADIISYNCRVGMLPAFTTIIRTLRGLSEQEAHTTFIRGRDPSVVGIIRLDNVQNYLRLRDFRIGRENKMNIGIAATFTEIEGVDRRALDPDDRMRRIAASDRKNLTVDRLRRMIDEEHLERVGILQWVTTLVHYVPALSHLRSQVATLYRTQTARLPLPVNATKVHPLATSGKNETVTTELKDAMVDFFAQIGQREDDYLPRLILASGDGLTYEKLLQMKRYLQLHTDRFQSFQLMEPVLELWHTMWTDLSRIFELHWGELLGCNPASLGHSAEKIGRAKPSNLKKVDYYPSAQLLYLVLDVRMLDCWRLYYKKEDIFDHFDHLATTKQLPTLAQLQETARDLFRTYMTPRAHHCAIYGSLSSTASKIIPTGPVETSKDDHHNGDHVLARSIMFMRDAMISREAAYAVAEGDVGRVYETLKVMLFTFAGSSHHKYTTYLLETVVNLEMECGPELRKLILHSWLVNLTGKPGKFCAGDLNQEHFNRLLQMIVERKGAEYGAPFIRNTIARNLHHLARLKQEWNSSVGLQKRSGAHADPHTRPEVRTLLELYKTTKLHHFCMGRGEEADDMDDFGRGMGSLREGKLQKWIQMSVRQKGLSPGIDDIAEDDETEPGDSIGHQTLGAMDIEDGQLAIHAQSISMDDEIDLLVATTNWAEIDSGDED